MAVALTALSQVAKADEVNYSNDFATRVSEAEIPALDVWHEESYPTLAGATANYQLCYRPVPETFKSYADYSVRTPYFYESIFGGLPSLDGWFIPECR